MSNIYRWNGSVWQKIKKIYRFNSSIAAKWQLIFQGTDAPQPKAPVSKTYVASTTYGTLNSETEFYSGDTIRTTRGDWTQNPTSIRIRVQSSQNPAGGYSTAGTADKTYNSTSSPTLANTDSNTYQSYTITAQDALYPSYYFRGLVQATNADGTTPLETAAILSRLGFSITSFTRSSITSYGATFSWSISGMNNDSDYVSSQTLTIRRVSDNVVVKTVDIAAGSSTAYVNDSSVISPNTQYYAKIVIVARDSWFSTASPTQEVVDNLAFTTTSNPPSNTVAPTITPLNNRGYLPTSTELTADKGTWSNVSASTTYEYDWWIEDSISGAVINSGYIGNTRTYTSIYAGDYLFVRVRATNSDGGVGTAVSQSYILDQAVTPSQVTPTSAIVNTSTNFSFNISHYPTSYVVDWGDGTSNSYTVSANTSTVNQTIAKTYTSTGNKTVIVTAQPGSKTSTTTVSVAVPTPTVSNVSLSDITQTPSQASGISVTGSTSNIATVSWTNGSPITSVNIAYSGAGTNGNYTDSSSPFDTSTTLNYSSSGTINITITTYNNNKRARISWNQANAASYAITYTLSGLGAVNDYGNNTGSSVNYDLTIGSTSRTVTLNSITVYSGSNQTGTSNTYNFSSSVTPTDKSSVGTGSGSVTYYTPAPVNTVAPTLSPTSIAVGTTLTAGVGSWINSPTSYDIRIYRGTAGVIMSETLVASGTSTTLNYTVTQADYDSGQRYFRTYVNASNAGGSSGFVAGQERGPIAAPTTYTVTWNANGGSVSPTSNSGVSGTVIYAPTPTRSGYTFLYWRDTPSGDYLYSLNAGASWTIFDTRTFYARWQAVSGSAPATPTGLVNVYNGGTSYTFSWDPSSGATSYQIIPYHATDSSGSGSTAKSSRNFTSGSTYDSSVDGGTSSTYVSFAVRATNANGSSAYSAIYTPYR
jgi:hypothetical protein